MLNREDFENPIDWVMYKVTGKQPNVGNPVNVEIVESDEVENGNPNLVDYSLPNGKFELKFYRNHRNRYSVHYNKSYLCMCDGTELENVQGYFDENFNGKNIKELSDHLKMKYNDKIKGMHHKNGEKIPKKRGRKGKTYKKNNLTFQKRRNGRYSVRVSHKAKSYTICQCDESQKDEVRARYDSLKKKHSLGEIQSIMKSEYNRISVPSRVSNAPKPVKRQDGRGKSFREHSLTFHDRENGRMQVFIRDNGVTHTVCHCSSTQRKEVTEKYETLKMNHSLDEIKAILKKEYNIQRKNHSPKKTGDVANHQIVIQSNGTVMKDGKFCTVDSKLYELVNRFVQ